MLFCYSTLAHDARSHMILREKDSLMCSPLMYIQDCLLGVEYLTTTSSKFLQNVFITPSCRSMQSWHVNYGLKIDRPLAKCHHTLKDRHANQNYGKLYTFKQHTGSCPRCCILIFSYDSYKKNTRIVYVKPFPDC